eukprot:CAMPEP_0184740170 /NCGR_PEP_ID=MMETSP0315-20130426/3176_1 /TAXON_ID=101924 /ORGANISM="Rhodosorus marinus, Strain UTEX LB 2760" /LENGTH=142 /DNA_ID=CAMNT_0027209669 /DNA_START=664 /DNA_END=1089 /DNA_ORIENTATION=-
MAGYTDFVIGALVFFTVSAAILFVWYVISKRQIWKVQGARQETQSARLESREIDVEAPSIANEFIVSIDGERRGNVFGENEAVDQDAVNKYLAEMSDSMDKTKHHDVVCSICLDELLEYPDAQCYIAPTCGHGFHLSCLGKW